MYTYICVYSRLRTKKQTAPCSTVRVINYLWGVPGGNQIINTKQQKERADADPKKKTLISRVYIARLTPSI